MVFFSFCRWHDFIFCCAQLICTCHHVQLLFCCIIWTGRSKEIGRNQEKYHSHSNGKAYFSFMMKVMSLRLFTLCSSAKHFKMFFLAFIRKLFFFFFHLFSDSILNHFNTMWFIIGSRL